MMASSSEPGLDVVMRRVVCSVAANGNCLPNPDDPTLSTSSLQTALRFPQLLELYQESTRRWEMIVLDVAMRLLSTRVPVASQPPRATCTLLLLSTFVEVEIALCCHDHKTW